MNAQDPVPSQLAQDYFELQGTYTGLLAITPGWMVPLTELKRRRLEKAVDKTLKTHIQHVYYNTHENGQDKNDRNSVVSQVIQHIDNLTPEILSETCDQLKIFLLAGRDTMGTTMAWAIYELSRTPHAMREVRGEADAILGAQIDATLTCAKLISTGVGGKDLLRRMPYTQAVVKETLRLHPPSGGMKFSKKGTGFTVHDSSTGKTHCLDGLAIYLCMPAIHRNPNVYGQTADVFSPERWMDTSASDKILTAAWRPFERGPRSCIAQELAINEISLALALLSQRHDFRKIGLGKAVLDGTGEPVLDLETGQYRVRDGMHNVLHLTSKPADGMRMEVKLADTGALKEPVISVT